MNDSLNFILRIWISVTTQDSSTHTEQHTEWIWRHWAKIYVQQRQKCKILKGAGCVNKSEGLALGKHQYVSTRKEEDPRNTWIRSRRKYVRCVLKAKRSILRKEGSETVPHAAGEKTRQVSLDLINTEVIGGFHWWWEGKADASHIRTEVAWVGVINNWEFRSRDAQKTLAK